MTEIAPAKGAVGLERFAAVAAWRGNRRLDRLVYLVDGDNKLLFDLENPVSVDTFVEFVGRRKQFVLEEAFPAPESLCIHGPEGRYVHEMVIPFTAGARQGRSRPLPLDGRASGRRHFPPGSEWLYAKIYTGQATADQLLRELIRPLLHGPTAVETIRTWFFVRYGDPEWQIRVRFRGEPSGLMSLVLPALHERYIGFRDTGAAAGLQIETYQREVERYGGPEAIHLAERFFHIDSDRVLKLLELFAGAEDQNLRWQVAWTGLDSLFADFGFDTKTRLTLARDGRERCIQALKANHPALRHQLGEEYRKHKRELDRWLTGVADDPNRAAAAAIGVAASERIREEVSSQLSRIAAAKTSTVSLQSCVLSFAHMHLNRMLRSAGMWHELVLYDFLARSCESRLARLRARVDYSQERSTHSKGWPS